MKRQWLSTLDAECSSLLAGCTPACRKLLHVLEKPYYSAVPHVEVVAGTCFSSYEQP